MICHIALGALWDQAQTSGEYHWSTLEHSIKDVGYLHASDSYEQAWRVASYLFDEVDSELMLLDLDREAMAAAGLSVVFEPFSPNDPGAENFPHVYGGALPVTCVTRETRFANSADLIDGLMAFQAAGSPPGIRSEEGEPQP